MKLLVSIFIMLGILSSFITPNQKKKTARVNITFNNTVNGEFISLEKQYTNSFNEQYSISKLKYYISNVSLRTIKNEVVTEKDSYHLISEPDGLCKKLANDFSFEIKSGTYESIYFLIGVDSIKNVSGAQTNALDPLNGMFWTWNTGYIMFKIEGSSQQSNIADNKFEYHVGGFSGSNNVLRRVELPLSSLQIKKGSNAEIVIEADIDKLWHSAHEIKIAEMPACTSAGNMASDIADNFSKIFSIKSITTK